MDKLSTIVFTDIKDFTLKTSLLTHKQIEDILNMQESILLPIIKKYKGNLVKTIWDSYMIVFNDTLSAIKCSIQIQKTLFEYNLKKKINLYKIELRISIDSWEIVEKDTIKWIDYFWDAVNIASRMQSITPENSIYVSENVYNKVEKNKSLFLYELWKTTFKWILYEINIFEVIYLKEEILNLKNWILEKGDINMYRKSEYWKKINEADELIFNCSSVSALLWLQPIPFLDTYNLIPVHIYMLMKIAHIYWEELDTKSAFSLFKKIISGVWAWYFSMQWTVWLTKILIPWVAGILTIPINFSITYSLWKIFSKYYYYESFWVAFTNKDIIEIFKDKREVWKQLAKTQKFVIIKNGEKFKNHLLEKSIMEEIWKKIKDLKK